MWCPFLCVCACRFYLNASGGCRVRKRNMHKTCQLLGPWDMPWSSFKCTCIHTHTHTGARLDVCAHAQMNTGTHACVPWWHITFLVSLHLTYWGSIFHLNLKFTHLVSGIPSSPPRHWDCRQTTTHLAFIYSGARDLNCGPHTWVAITVLWATSPASVRFDIAVICH